MNLNGLTTNMMLNLTALWLNDKRFRSLLTSGSALGNGILVALEKAHAPLKALQNNRNEARVQQRELIDRSAELDDRHDSLARALHHHLRGFAEAAQDQATVRHFEALIALLYPIGLAVTRLPYIEEAGAAVALEDAVKPATRAELTALQVGVEGKMVRLIDLFDEWMMTAQELGRVVQQRGELAVASTRDGSNGEWMDVKAGRIQWIRVVRGLLWALDLEPELASLRESVVSGLRRALATARRRAAQAAGSVDETTDVDEHAGGLLDGDDDVVSDGPVTVALEDEEFGVDTIDGDGAAGE